MAPEEAELLGAPLYAVKKMDDHSALAERLLTQEDCMVCRAEGAVTGMEQGLDNS